MYGCAINGEGFCNITKCVKSLSEPISSEIISSNRVQGCQLLAADETKSIGQAVVALGQCYKQECQAVVNKSAEYDHALFCPFIN